MGPEASLGDRGPDGSTHSRCNECVGAHVSCHLVSTQTFRASGESAFPDKHATQIPDKAIEAVDKLSKAAADAVASDGVSASSPQY